MGNFCSNMIKSREEWLKTPNKPRRPATNMQTSQNASIPTNDSIIETVTVAETTSITAPVSNTNIPLIIDSE
jgi:hypothetical protein